MRIDITTCTKLNVTDSCAFWNILSSPTFYSVLIDQKFDFACTDFIVHECLHKKRTEPTKEDSSIQNKFKLLLKTRKVVSHKLSIEDLQDDEILKYRKSLGKGELSSIAFAKKTRLSFHSDDQGARKIAEQILGVKQVQTTPLLLGWLFYNNHLSDRDLEPIIKDHISAGRPLERFFREVHEESWRIKLQTKSI